jgi:hypothetical protein
LFGYFSSLLFITGVVTNLLLVTLINLDNILLINIKFIYTDFVAFKEQRYYAFIELVTELLPAAPKFSLVFFIFLTIILLDRSWFLVKNIRGKDIYLISLIAFMLLMLFIAFIVIADLSGYSIDLSIRNSIRNALGSCFGLGSGAEGGSGGGYPGPNSNEPIGAVLANAHNNHNHSENYPDNIEIRVSSFTQPERVETVDGQTLLARNYGSTNLQAQTGLPPYQPHASAGRQRGSGFHF